MIVIVFASSADVDYWLQHIKPGDLGHLQIAYGDHWVVSTSSAQAARRIVIAIGGSTI